MNIVGILLITIAVLAGIDVVMYLVLSVVDRHWISTHTLTWSVTVPILGLTNAQNISTHTLTWSVTRQC
ncbi:hypothetical protein DWY44_01860 [Ruminococcus sp. AF25-19]|jgi:hypothetical protein|nr:hypothetical protein DWY44_01860 [Ruminococcus sp. AF25-19]